MCNDSAVAATEKCSTEKYNDVLASPYHKKIIPKSRLVRLKLRGFLVSFSAVNRCGARNRYLLLIWLNSKWEQISLSGRSCSRLLLFCVIAVGKIDLTLQVVGIILIKL